MIIDKNKIIFLHIPKTGGNSVESHLSKEFNCNVKFRHYTLNQIYNELKDKDLENYTIFTVLRNPLEKIVSTYNHTKTHKHIINMSFQHYINYLLMYYSNKFPDNEYQSNSYMKINNKNVIDKRHIEKLNYWIDIPNVIKLSDCKLLVENNHFILSFNNIKIYLLRFNHLNKDFKNFSKIINTKPYLPHYNINPITKSKKSTYMSYYKNFPNSLKNLKKIYLFELSIYNFLFNK